MPAEACGPSFCAVASAAPVAYLLSMTAPQPAAELVPSVASAHDKILIVDFGSQVTQLIARRVREEGVYSEIVPFQKAEAAFREMKPKAVILSGGPELVHEAGSPRAPQAPAARAASRLHGPIPGRREPPLSASSEGGFRSGTGRSRPPRAPGRRNQLRHLTAEIDDQNLVMRRGHRRHPKSAAGGGISWTANTRRGPRSQPRNTAHMLLRAWTNSYMSVSLTYV